MSLHQLCTADSLSSRQLCTVQPTSSRQLCTADVLIRVSYVQQMITKSKYCGNSSRWYLWVQCTLAGVLVHVRSLIRRSHLLFIFCLTERSFVLLLWFYISATAICDRLRSLQPLWAWERNETAGSDVCVKLKKKKKKKKGSRKLQTNVEVLCVKVPPIPTPFYAFVLTPNGGFFLL